MGQIQTTVSAKTTPVRAGSSDHIPEISVILPVRNEQESLQELNQELRSTLLAMRRRIEIIYVDDCSTDSSAEILQGLVAQAADSDIQTRVITLRRGYGQTAALAAGIDIAEGETIILLDADGQNNPADIPRLIEKMEEGYDVVGGWRHQRNDRLILRKIPSMAASWLVRVATGVSLHDTGCTLKAYRASFLKEIKLYGDMHRFMPVFLAERGARVGELNIDHRPRRGGKSKYGTERILKTWADLFYLYFLSRCSTRPMQFFGRIGIMFFLATLLSIMLMFTFKYGWLAIFGITYQASFTETPLPTLAATFFIGAVSSIFAGLLAEILIRIQYESQGKQIYSIKEISDSGDRGE